MLSRLTLHRAGAQAARLQTRIATTPARRLPRHQQRRTLVAAPKRGDGPLMERRPDRELPSLEQTTFRWSRTLPFFAAAIALASVAIFNYQKLSSPVVGATLYALRTSDRARELLGDEIYFARNIPWIAGEMNQLHGRIDIRFRVKGTRATGTMRFASFRPSPRGMFETTEWSLETEDGTIIDLLEDGDPFRAMTGAGGDAPAGGLVGAAGLDADEDKAAPSAATRGFRK